MTLQYTRISINGVALNVGVGGPADGPAVLLIHGFPDDHQVWRHQWPALIAAGYRVIAPDLRGFGWTDAPPGGYRKERMASDVLAHADEVTAGGEEPGRVESAAGGEAALPIEESVGLGEDGGDVEGGGVLAQRPVPRALRHGDEVGPADSAGARGGVKPRLDRHTAARRHLDDAAHLLGVLVVVLEAFLGLGDLVD